MLSPYIFRGYDIRGVYGKDITEETAATIGKAFATTILSLGFHRCVVGRDNRLSSPNLAASLMEGITSCGVDVIDLGTVTTPMFYYASIKLGIPSGVMVTASHNPKEENGFKIAYDEAGNIKGETIQELYQTALRGDFAQGIGSITPYSIKEDYHKLMQESLSFGPRRVKVVIDCGNGTTALYAKELYEKFPIDLISLFQESDGNFPNHHPDPSVEANLGVLKETVLKEHADLGIAFDGDGDRAGFVDHLGHFIASDEYMILIIRSIIDQVEPKLFVYDVKCTKALEDDIKRLGGTPYCYRTGNSYMKAKVKEMNSPFGGELSGHVFFRDRFPGFDSGLYAGLRLVELLSKTDKTIPELLEGKETYYATPELKFSSTDEKKWNVIKKIQEYAENKQYSLLLIDGVKVLFEDGWALIRCSNTGPNITARFEAKTEKRLRELQEEFVQVLEEWNQ